MTPIASWRQAQGAPVLAATPLLLPAGRPAWRRISGRWSSRAVTRARKDGSAEKIAAAIQRDRAASDAADRILAECNAGMRLITRACWTA